MTQLEATKSTKGSVAISATVPGMEGPKAEIGMDREGSVKSTSATSARYESFGVSIQPSLMSIVSDSELAGNVVAGPPVPVTFATDPATIWRQYPGDQVQHPRGDFIEVLVTGTHFEKGEIKRPTAAPRL
jgi:hypothetical protein